MARFANFCASKYVNVYLSNTHAHKSIVSGHKKKSSDVVLPTVYYLQ